MKRIIILLILCLFFNIGFSQTSRDALSGKYTPPITKDKLNTCRYLSDVIPNFPTHWGDIIDYVSVNIMVISDGQVRSEESVKNLLTWEQMNILSAADIGTEISIKIKFRWRDTSYANSHTGKIQEMNEYRLAVVPEHEAEFPGGFLQLTKYLKESKINRFQDAAWSGQFPRLMVMFTINEEGKLVNARIPKPSADEKADKLLLEAVNEMPNWKPAENSKGVKIKQEFRLLTFREGC